MRQTKVNGSKGFFRNRRLVLSVAAVVLAYALLGFFLAPWLVKNTAISTVRESYGAELRIEKVAINPFVLSLRIDGLEMDDPNGDSVGRLEQFFINFQLSSVFRWALTFSEIRFDSPELFLVRGDSGDFNLAFLAVTEADAAIQEEPSILRLIVQDFAVNDAALHWNDAVPAEPVATTFGPVDVQILNLSTLSEREGQQDVVITTETFGTLSWNGSLQLNPLRSVGSASVKGSHFPLMSAYMRDSAGFEVVRGNADIKLDYAIDTSNGGDLEASIDNLNLTFNDVLLRTFGLTASDGSDIDRDVLEVPRFNIDGGTLRFPERAVVIGTIAVDDSVLSLYRNDSGDLNILSKSATSTEAVEDDTTAQDATSNPAWSVSLDRFGINRMAIGLIDDSVTPQSNIGVKNLSVGISGIDNSPGTIFPTEMSLSTPSGGTVSSKGTITVFPDPIVDLEVAVAEISLAVLHPYIKTLADVDLDSGVLGMTIKLHTGPEEPLSLVGDLAITDFLISETDEGSTLGRWDAFALNQIAFSLAEENLDISEIRIDRAYGDIFIAEDGSVNLGRVAPGRQSSETTAAEKETVVSVDKDAAAAEIPILVTIGRVSINDAAADFADYSLPLPFAAKIASLNGTLTTIASESAEPSEVALEGKVDEYGLVRVSGTVTPLQPALNTDLNVRFENVAMPKFSAYTVPFAGREIASGKLDLDLGYAVQASELVGRNKIVLRDFELGEKVEHPGAMSLPLGLAVALLKGPDGSIDIDLPVRGNVDDPEFRYGSVVGKALLNLVVKVVASPFALLGKLVGAEADELEFIGFQDGRADLTPPEQEKAAKLAEALTLRPELTLEIHGVVDREADGLALRTALLDQFIDEQIGTPVTGDEVMYGERKTEILEDLYVETLVVDDQENALVEMRVLYTTAVTDDAGKLIESFDELAYVNELRRQLIDVQPMAERDLVELGVARAQNLKSAILTAKPAVERQIAVGNPQAVERDADDVIRMKVSLAANGGKASSVSTGSTDAPTFEEIANTEVSGLLDDPIELADEGLSEEPVQLNGRLSIADLEGVEWQFREFVSGDILSAERDVTLTVDGDAIGGQGPCNRYFASVTEGAGAGELSLGPVGSTRMMCPPDVMTAEMIFMDALSSVVKFSFVAGDLVLTSQQDGSIRTMVFEASGN
jgi:heat shock protein HslJ